ncbi:hypothetical protein JB92DRAFT_2955228 [Gautieria morchelliformis]|nr:hypothetical protein JB92DRAFT_2955228 [Gautieria morchelliformis]
MATEEPQASSSKLSAPSSTFSFTAPFPLRAGGVTSSKQRRVSLPSSPRFSPTPGWPFRDEMGLEAMSSGAAASVTSDKDKKLRKVDLDVAAGSVEESLTPGQEKRQRKKWTMEETQMLVDGCNKYGVGNWKIILNDPTFTFDNRTPVDLKDRFRTYFPDAYKEHYPNAKTHLSSKVRSALPDGSSIFEKTRSKKRRPFTLEEDEALKRGYDKHGTLWASILKDPIFHAKNRRSTDLRDRFRNAFPDLYEAAGYKPRVNASKKKKGSEGLPVPVVSDSGHDDSKESQAMRPLRRKRASTAPGLKLNHTRRVIPESTTCSDSEESSGGEESHGNEAMRVSKHRLKFGHDEVTPQPADPSERSQSVEVSLADLPRSPLDSSGGFSRNNVSTRSSCSLSLSEATDSSPARPWSLPETVAQSHTPNWVPASSPSPRRAPPNDIFLSSQASPPTTNPRKAGEGFHTMIGKSAWVPEDWLSANPRLESSRPDSSGSSFISGPSPAPSSPFSFSPSSHGVMDRYDLFPANLTAHSLDYTSSEVGYGDRDNHSAFSEADMFNPATASYRGFTHHSNYAGDLIFAAGRSQQPPGLTVGGSSIHERGLESSLEDSNVRRMGLRSGLPGIDEIPLAAIRLQDRGATLDADMEEAEIVHSRGTSTPPDEEMSAIPPDLDFQITPLSPEILAATPTSLTNPISPISLHSNGQMTAPKSRQSSGEHAHAHHHHLASSSHCRSFSQPPAEHRTSHEHLHASTHSNSSPFPNSTRSQSLFDPSQPPSFNEPWRSFDLTDLPFLDLHYYTSNSAHAQTMALLQDPVVESSDNAANALDLASAGGGPGHGHGSNASINSAGIAPAQLHAHTPSQYHSLAQAQLQTTPVTVAPAATTGRPNHHHHRVQSAASPDDLLLKKSDNKRKRVSWDGGAAS